MHSQLTTYITLVSGSGVLNLYLFIRTFLKRHRYTNVLRFFLLHTAATTVYCFAAAFGLLSTSLSGIKFWTFFQYVGIAVAPPLGLLFVMDYLGMKITKGRVLALLVVPSITLLMVATNDWHSLHYRVFEIDQVIGAPYIYQEIGPWYMVHGVFIFSCMFVAFLLGVSRWKETATVYRPQLVALLFSQLLPILTAFLYLLGLTPPGVDPVPMVLWLSSLLYLWSIRSSRLFTLMPIAKDTIFNSINDGVLVLDEARRLVDYNESAKSMFPSLQKSMLGLDFDYLWMEMTGKSFSFHVKKESCAEEVQLSHGEVAHTYQVRTSLLKLKDDCRGMLLIFTDITELKKLQRKLEQLAYHDELTQVYNRRAFFRQCELDFAEAKEASTPFTVMLIDIDHFKTVNDTYGHQIGDQVLIQTVKVCQAQMDEQALFARFGGEEFVVALKGADVLEGVALAERMRVAVEQHPVMTEEGAVHVTLSIGVAEAKGETLGQLLNRADQALYGAKREGRNQVCITELNVDK
ncbi:MAG: diguanylate cyclase [Lysinibacillus sp.]